MLWKKVRKTYSPEIIVDLTLKVTIVSVIVNWLEIISVSKKEI